NEPLVEQNRDIAGLPGVCLNDDVREVGARRDDAGDQHDQTYEENAAGGGENKSAAYGQLHCAYLFLIHKEISHIFRELNIISFSYQGKKRCENALNFNENFAGKRATFQVPMRLGRVLKRIGFSNRDLELSPKHHLENLCRAVTHMIAVAQII